MARDLVVIEAVGKLRSVHHCIQAIGLDADVVATLGHLYENSPDLRDLGIVVRNGEFVETDRRPIRREAHDFLLQHLKNCKGRVLLATDDDSEGHVIASDVATLAAQWAPTQPVLRVLPHALTPEGWTEALAKAEPWQDTLAFAGTARRIADRLIASIFSDPDKGLVVGRVQGAIVGLAEQGLIPSEGITLRCPSTDDRGDFLASTTLPAGALSQILPPAVVSSQRLEPVAAPMNGGDALLALNHQLALSIDDASALLQSMYEAGQISYPRSPARGLRAEGAKIIALLAQRKGVRAFRVDALPRVEEHAGPAHEAVHVLPCDLVNQLELGRPLRLCRDVREAAAMVLVRHNIESGVTVSRERPAVDQLPLWAQGLPWARDGRLPALPWRRRDPQASFPLSPDAAVVHAQMNHGLGRPSTWASHATRMSQSGWLAPDHRLNLAGRVHASAMAPILRDPRTSVAIESTFENDRDSVTDRVMKALQIAFHSDTQAVRKLVESLTVMQEGPDERLSFTI